MESQDTPVMFQDIDKKLSQHFANNMPHARQHGIEAAAKILADRLSTPTMFWNNDDPETCQSSIFAVVEEAWGMGVIEPGETMVIQRAVRLENITVRVIPDAKNSEYIDYEIVEGE